MRTGTLLSLLLVLFLSTVVLADYLEQAKVVLIDHTPRLANGYSNFLFRGNEPKIYNSTLGQDVFAYDELRTFLAKAAAQKNVTLPPKYLIHDIKLYYFKDPLETPDLELEANFFKRNPSLGAFTGLEIWGDEYSPNWVSAGYRKEWATTLGQWEHDNLPSRIPWLRKLLYSQQALPLVVYFHCECGCDRTGEIAGSYVIKYMNVSFTEAMDWNDAIAGRWILPNHEFAIEWYCYYLFYVEGFTHLQCY